MKLEVGMYVRYKRGSMGYNIEPADKIGKIINRVNESDIYELDNNNNIFENDVVKASFNIIDLIKEGDYVNKHLVKEIFLSGERRYIKLDNSYANGEGIRIYEEDIKTIVTHEQFENMKYEVDTNAN